MFQLLSRSSASGHIGILRSCQKNALRDRYKNLGMRGSVDGDTVATVVIWRNCMTKTTPHVRPIDFRSLDHSLTVVSRS